MPEKSRPVIGLTGYFVDHSEIGPENRVRGLPGQDWALFSMDYVRSVEASGGIPLLLPVQSVPPGDLLERVDGLLLAGGPDIDPALYGEKPIARLGKVNPERDHFELGLTRAALEMGKPLLGICRGMQMLNVALGGTLYQDLSQQVSGALEHTCLQYPKWHPTHVVQLSAGSRLARIFPNSDVSVNSFHHQAVRDLGEGLTAAARSEDGIVEGIELGGDRFVVGVQWHPEMMTEHWPVQVGVFRALVEAARG